MIDLHNITLLLASQSPRRRALLKELGFPVLIVKPPDIEEVFPGHMQGRKIPEYLAKLKSEAYTDPLIDNQILVTADTIVWIDGRVIGKPSSPDDAICMLQALSGNKHQVFTGVCLKYGNRYHVFSDETQVYFKTIRDEEIRYYVDKCKPFDKAGAYGIQEWIGFIGVERIDGSYFNVMGLPTHRIYEAILKISNLQ